jgi:hypothetical protein
LKLACAGQTPPWVANLESVMQAIPEVSAQVTPETQASFVLDLVAIVCGLAVVVFICPATYGLDMSLGFF